MRAWEEFLTQQEKELGIETVKKWLRPLKVVRFDACNLYLEAADSFKTLWFEEHMRHKVQTSFFNNNQKQIKVHVSLASQASEKKQLRKKDHKPAATNSFFLKFDDLDSNYQFQNFIVFEGNVLAFRLLCDVCDLDPKTFGPKENKTKAPVFNPIYLSGPSGSGKTHLMMAAASQLQKSGKKAIYVRAETFTEHVVNAIRSGEMQIFRKTYRHTDVLLIDNIEILSRKGATQEELFHTFNTLHIEGKQIVLGSCFTPQELEHVEPRLISRFEWGIVSPLQMLGKENMIHIVQQRIQKLNFPLQDEVVQFLLTTFGSNAKNLVRAFDALVLRTHLNPNLPTLPLSLSHVKHLLSDLIQQEENSSLTPGKIIRTVAEYYGICSDDILSESQKRECAFPRQIAMLLCRQKLNLPYTKIGSIFSRDHSTVMNSIKQIQKGIDQKNHEIVGMLNGITKLLMT